MRDKLKPYPQYKNSDVSWIGNIPNDWIILRNKYFLFELNIHSITGDEELLTVSQYTGITKRKDRLKEEIDLLTTASTLEGYKIVEKEAMVMNIMLAWNGSLGVSEFHGIVSPAYCVFRINKNLVFPKYLHYLHRTKLYTGIFETASTGVIKSRLRLYPDNYLALTSVLPPPAEQHRIARYLDWKTSQIAKFIKAKKQMIELLKEQKQVIINNAVTGKIDVRTGKPYPKYKESDVEWMGKMPESWEMIRIKHISRILRGKFNYRPRNDPRFYGGDYPFIQTGDVARSGKYISNYNQTLNKSGFLISKEFPKGTLVMTIAANIGEVSILEFDACFPDSIVGFIPTTKMDLNFLYLIFLSMKHELLKQAPVNTQGNLNIERIGSMFIPLPKRETQNEILSCIEKQTNTIDLTIIRTEREIALMQEYRTRLIADVVTGKVDVRDVVVPFNAIDTNDIEDTSVEEEFVEETDEQSVNE